MSKGLSGSVVPKLSVVVPCFNEEAVLPSFIERMAGACQTAARGSYEIILVNDGSTDNTWACMRTFALTRPGIVAIQLSRNHGHQLAVTAGLSQARGERILVIDADLQDPPELLDAMMAHMDEPCDVVYGRRRARSGESNFKRGTAHFFYRLLERMSNVVIPNDTGDFRLMSRSIVDKLNTMPEQDRFLRGMVAWLGGRQTEILYDRDVRCAGKTKYTILKMISLAASGLTSFSTIPLRLAALLTGFGILIGCATALYAVIGLLNGRNVPGWTSLAILIAFFSTAQMGCLAVLSVYIGRIFVEVKRRPLFLVEEIVASDARLALSSSFETTTLKKEKYRAGS
jgi:glycosyltransferase involved in cell wall biosynthesis